MNPRGGQSRRRTHRWVLALPRAPAGAMPRGAGWGMVSREKRPEPQGQGLGASRAGGPRGDASLLRQSDRGSCAEAEGQGSARSPGTKPGRVAGGVQQRPTAFLPRDVDTARAWHLEGHGDEAELMLVSEDTCPRPAQRPCWEGGARPSPLMVERPRGRSQELFLPSLVELGSLGLWQDIQGKCQPRSLYPGGLAGVSLPAHPSAAGTEEPGGAEGGEAGRRPPHPRGRTRAVLSGQSPHASPPPQCRPGLALGERGLSPGDSAPACGEAWTWGPVG